MRKLSDADVTRIRELWSEGWSAGDLADEFGVSRQHVGRLVREEQRSTVAGLDADRVQADGVGAAVDRLLDEIDTAGVDAAIAAVARALASQIDACAQAGTASAAQALARLSAELVGVLDDLRGTERREPSALARIQARREARLLASAVQHADRRSAAEGA